MLSNEELQEIKLFLGLLYSWDEEGEALFKSVSWTFVTREGEQTFANYAAQKLDDLVRLITTRANRPGANVYSCLGTQRTALIETMTTDGFPKAQRTKANIVSFKSVALDIDVKPGAYATTQDARNALNDFIRVVGLPEPTMLVLSGSGGIHCYWCFDKPIPQAHWSQLARALQAAALNYKLKFDPQITVNPAGILRVPNTFNHKSTPATKVRLLREGTFPRYSYQQLVGALSNYTPAIGGVPPELRANQKRSRNFTSGVENAPPVTIDEVAVNCMTIDDILDRGGDGDAEPLWNLAILAASFTSDPHDAAHRLSDGDPRYVYADTEKKLIEKINARSTNPDVGWPTCKSFGALSPTCAMCPLYAMDKTPFHHVVRSQPQADSTQYAPMPGSDPLLPGGYWRNKLNHIMTTLYKKNGESYTAEIVNYPIHDAGLDSLTGELCYLVTVGGENYWRSINVSACMQPAHAATALSRGNSGIFVNPKNHIAARDFLVAWVGHLQTIKKTANQSAYGWSDNHKAFAFDDKIYHETRTETVHRGKHHDINFTVQGKLKPWQDAMALVYGNLPLETIVASAFAAPLVSLVGSSSLVLSAYSQLSGVGKTTAMMLAQSVWGHPRSGMSTLADTTNSMMKKIGDLKSLPVYWDELRTKDQLEKVIDIVFQVTQGKGKARLNQDTTQAEAPIFTTMFVVASNHGLNDTVYSQTESTEAGGLRLFEIEPQSLRSSTSTYNANQMIIPLQNNYGVAGAAYAEWLAQNRKNVEAVLKRANEDLDARHKFAPKERFWSMTMATLLVGAGLANHCGLTDFDLAGLSRYLDDMLARQRGEMKAQEYATMSATKDVVGLIQEMISDVRGKNLIVTETITYGQVGRPVPSNLVDTDLSRLGDVWLQFGDRDGRVRARVRPFNDWLRKRYLNPKTILDALRAHYVVTLSKQTVGAGVAGLDATVRFSRTTCYDFTPLRTSSPNPDSDEPS
jgi:Domain of unknown function (DUF927)